MLEILYKVLLPVNPCDKKGLCCFLIYMIVWLYGYKVILIILKKFNIELLFAADRKKLALCNTVI